MIVVVLVIVVAMLLRLYRINEYAVFLSDQAIDSNAVKSILEGHLTLLGPRASVGNFFNGPIVYYLMVPFYLLLHNDPLAGTFFQIAIQIVTVPFLYLLGRRLAGVTGGLVTIWVFALSPVYIDYSRGAFNAYPAILCVTIVTYLLTARTVRPIAFFVSGVLTGMMVQMHYLLYPYALGYALYLIWRWRSVRILVVYLTGFVVGLAPFLLFEVRHDFLNLRMIVSQGQSLVTHLSLIARVMFAVRGLGTIVGIGSGVAGLLLVTIGTLSVIFRHRSPMYLRVWFIVHVLIFSGTLVLYRGVLQSHYMLGFHIVFVLGAVWLLVESTPRWFVTVVCIALFLRTCVFGSDIFRVPKAHDGLSLQDQRTVAKIVYRWRMRTDQSSTWNITQDAQQDNRAMPLRYLLSLDNDLYAPRGVEDYYSNAELYLLARSDKKLQDIKTWEVQSFGTQYATIQRSRINDVFTLYHLRKLNGLD